eukprot:7173043-Lingulodinium_polyedra.AAC.1
MGHRGRSVPRRHPVCLLCGRHPGCGPVPLPRLPGRSGVQRHAPGSGRACGSPSVGVSHPP